MFFQFDFDAIWRALPYLFRQGMSFTLTLTIFATLGGLVLGTLLALMQLSKSSLIAKAAAGYVNLMRSLLLVLVIFWFYFLVPYLGQIVMRADRPIETSVRAQIKKVKLGRVQSGGLVPSHCDRWQFGT